jgi:hypothetical protein
MIEIRACAADFAQLVAAENVQTADSRRFSDYLIRKDQIRGHDENGRTTSNSPIADEQTEVAVDQCDFVKAPPMR